MSLGRGRPSPYEERAFNDLYSAGILSVAAACNDGFQAIAIPPHPIR